ncbi:MAG: hemolysin family protein [Candidatus Melainabacteria bacterium]|nr:hemolysin family protein [Candidatus Melainabacteria bacterium]
MFLAWFIAIGLILLNAIYVAAEFATVAARHSYIQKLALAGNPLASLLLPILEEPRKLDEYIATCQIGITVSSLVLGAYSEISFGPSCAATLVEYFNLTPVLAESVAAIGILLLFTLLQILFGELLPKSVSLQYSDRIAIFMYWPLRLSSIVFRPFIWLLNGSGNFFLKVLGIPVSTHKHVHSLDEIELLLAESKDGGLLEPVEHERLQQALDLGERTARQLMVPRSNILAVSNKNSLEECYRIALASPYTRLLVYGDSIDDVLGFIHVRHVIQARFSESDLAGIDSLIKGLPIIPENLRLGKLIALLKSKHSHMAVVMDEHGATVGIVTAGDILAELIENVDSDEFKKTIVIEALEDGRIRLPGFYKLHRASKFLGQMPETEAETINGLIMEILDRVPAVGDLIELPSVVIEVEEVEHHAAILVIVSRKEEAKQDV